MALFKFFSQSYKYISKDFYGTRKILFGGLHITKPHVQAQSLHGEVNTKLEAKLRSKDGIGEDYKIIYRAPYETYCKVCYSLGAISTTIFPALFSTLLFSQGIINYPIMLGNYPLIKALPEIFVFAGGLILTIGNASIVIHRYPYRIYHNSSKNTYIFVYQHFWPWKNDNQELKGGELKKTEKSFMPWHESLYEFRNKKAILIESHFYRPIDLEMLLQSNKKKEK